MAQPSTWRIWVDTGGTFTDCLAVDPGGALHRAKVLSTSALRGRVVAVLDGRHVEIEAPWQAPDGFFAGFEWRRLGGGETTAVSGYDAASRVVELAAEPTPEPVAGEGFELLSEEEAPVLAVRLVTGTVPGRSLPPVALRLATTRGTNALLEGKGAQTALFITRGFGDLLEIGTQQRPDLFALAVVKPRPLPAVVVEVEERLAADGSVLVPLDPAAVERAGIELRARGIEAAAVAFLHSYRNPAHEQAAAAALRRAGIAQVSASAELAPRIKILPRAETAVVDAYLGPVIRGYLERVATALGSGSSLHVMTSAGGLARAESFHPKDSLLSGPAGGVVGAARAGRRAGFRRLIGFDMGGTSTDVARYDGDFDYTFEHQVGRARLAAPALAVETVAAGGGSTCAFDGTQLLVGPESAGARPGPACYGAGGPLTLTDVNLLLGRLAPGFFGIPLDQEAAERAFRELLAPLHRSSPAVEPEAVLEGLLAIADERMAGAIRTLSVARGYDPADYALLAFGGAGGQHACAVAALLGISTVIVPPDAGLLSAAGLGAAVVERFRERQVLAPLSEVEAELPAWLASLGREAAAAVAAEGVAEQEIVVRRRMVHLRLLGQEASLAVEWSEGEDLAAAFVTAYQSLYGYRPLAGCAVEIESLRVVASSRPEPELAVGPVPSGHAARASGRSRAFFDGAWRETAAFARHELEPGAELLSPGLVLEAHATTVVPPGWQGRVDASGALILTLSEIKEIP